MLSEVIVRNANDHAVEAPLPGRHYNNSVKAFSPWHRCRPDLARVGAHSCPSLLIFSVDSVFSVVKALKSASIPVTPRQKVLTFHLNVV